MHRHHSMLLTEQIRARGHPEIRHAHTQVFASLPLDGARLTTVAARAGITKQSMMALVSELESLGYLTRSPDPSDGRASLIRFSAKGLRMFEDAADAAALIRRDYAEKVGQKRIDAFERTLVELVAALEIDIPA